MVLCIMCGNETAEDTMHKAGAVMRRLTALILAAAVIVGTLADGAAGIEWKVVNQPDLAAALDAAPQLKFEDVADGPDSCWEGPLWWVPNPDGKTWDMVFIYNQGYQGPHQIFIYDTVTKELKRDAINETIGNNFHIVPYLLIGGKMLIKPGMGAKDVKIHTYDPATNTLAFGSLPVGENVVTGDGQLVPNDDGTLLGGFGALGGDKKNRDRVGFYTIDPVTLKGDFLGEVGPPSSSRGWELGGVVMDGDWIYARYGHSPWRLYGMNVKTRQGSIIAETERFMGDRDTITFRQHPNHPGVYVTITGMKGKARDKKESFWLRDGELTPCEPAADRNVVPVPPWSSEKLASPRQNFFGRMEGASNPPKGIEIVRNGVDPQGNVLVWYRYTDAAMAEAANVKAGEWQKIVIEGLTLYPALIRRMAVLPDDSIFALSEGYARAVRYDPKTKKRTHLGQTMSVYSVLPFEEKLYICGYPGSQTWIYDPSQPWTAGQTVEAPPEDGAKGGNNKSGAATATTNPANVAMLKDFNDVHMPMACAAGGDGRVYFGGKVVRIGNGGGLGWWDAKEHKGGGFHDAFDTDSIFWMCSAADGRYIVCSTKPVPGRDNPDYVPPRGRLFVYDTQTQEIIHKADDERLDTFPGYITEAMPGLVMGYAPKKNGVASGLLYGFDPAAGKVLWTKPVPRSPQTAMSFMRRGRYAFAKGPDGLIWATLNGVLARIDPLTAKVMPVGKMEDNPIAFVDGDVYVAGAEKFRRIAGIPKVTAAKSKPNKALSKR